MKEALVIKIKSSGEYLTNAYAGVLCTTEEIEEARKFDQISDIKSGLYDWELEELSDKGPLIIERLLVIEETDIE